VVALENLSQQHIILTNGADTNSGRSRRGYSLCRATAIRSLLCCQVYRFQREDSIYPVLLVSVPSTFFVKQASTDNACYFFERLKTTLRGQSTVPNLPAVCLPASLPTDAVSGPLSLSVSTTYASRRTNMKTDVEGHPQYIISINLLTAHQTI
jgi:hypothetical protein